VTGGDYHRTVALMGTVVTIRVVGQAADSPQSLCAQAVEHAFAWFREIEEICTRFEPQNEVMQLASQPGVAVPVSPILFEAARFAIAVAEESGGAFDPTVGRAMEDRGFNQEYRTRRSIRTELPPASSVSYKDVRLDPDRRTIMLLRPLILDLGAVAKGLAIDMAAKELQPFENFCIDAGGDLFVGGHNPSGNLWSVGIRHPRRAGELIDSLRVSDRAVCTSGDYERTTLAEDGGHHILDPRTQSSPRATASVTVVAPMAILADAVATAAFVLGPVEGIRLCERLGVDALMFSPSLERCATQGMSTAHVC
jgi:thiamine biosynthesis lipoprotein